MIEWIHDYLYYHYGNSYFQKPAIVKYFSAVSGWQALFDGDKHAVKYFILLISGRFTL